MTMLDLPVLCWKSIGTLTALAGHAAGDGYVTQFGKEDRSRRKYAGEVLNCLQKGRSKRWHWPSPLFSDYMADIMPEV